MLSIPIMGTSSHSVYLWGHTLSMEQQIWERRNVLTLPFSIVVPLRTFFCLKKKQQQNYHFHCSIISFIWFCALSVFKPSYWTHKHGLIQTFISYMPSTQKCTKLFVAEIYCLINIQDFINTSLSNSFLFGSVLVHGDFQTGKMDIWHFEHLFFFP